MTMIGNINGHRKQLQIQDLPDDMLVAITSCLSAQDAWNWFVGGMAQYSFQPQLLKVMYRTFQIIESSNHFFGQAPNDIRLVWKEELKNLDTVLRGHCNNNNNLEQSSSSHPLLSALGK